MSDQCGSVTTKNKQNWIRSRGGGVLFLGAQLSNKTLSFSSENHEKMPGIETNPPLQNYPYNFNFHMDHANEKGVSSS